MNLEFLVIIWSNTW